MSSKTKIILAEDEPALAQIIKESLETRNFEVVLCKNGEEAFDAYTKEKPELLVLDVMMPKKDGFTLAKEIRKLDKKTPIVFLTAKSQTQDVVDGFQLGGNDYLKKPFSMEELIVRIHSLLGRIQPEKNEEDIVIGSYLFNLTKQTLNHSGNMLFLTHREASLLHLLVENKNDILDRSLVLKKIWGDDDFFNGRSMDVFITKLRKKLSLDPNIQIINVRSQGYKLIL
ncbi:DNA-binding response OmpR family regulator [Flavobacterium gossypii]|uniref:DNA-binding response OmpR family regulator n=2 Tax=Flavobacterium TaxID=237 RepID=A0A495MN64_9FLAO|nr:MULTISPECIES: response regulator transcription factor [Flavobacterium]MBA9073795.1 DNA-binding response OmpR family regulator [Flavobacterium gossypii]RKS26820.1 DNA-binding response OmpR family regulator [Flavobacterium endophyticum]